MPTKDKETKQEVRKNRYTRPKGEEKKNKGPRKDDPPIVIKGRSFHVESEPELAHSSNNPGRRTHHYDADPITITQIQVFDRRGLVCDIMPSGAWRIHFFS